MLIKSIISFVVAVFLEFTVYSPVQNAVFGSLLDVAASGGVPWHIILLLRIGFFIIGFAGTFTLLLLIPGIREL